MRSRSPLVLLAAILALLAIRGDAQSATTITLPSNFSDSLIASVASPTALAFTPDGRLLITTQPGQLRIYENGSLVSTPALDLNNHPTDICTTSERGLLGVAVDPSFAGNGYIYLYWSPGTSGNCRNRLSRFTLTGNTVAFSSEVILVDNIPAPNGTHNAGDVHVGKDGHLYVSVGDGGCDYAGNSGCSGSNDAARDMHALVGKVLRITLAGGIPADNPFQGTGTVRCNTGTSTAPNKCREIFATGLRNPFRMAFDPNAAGTKFHINDVGQNTWEEIDLGIAGADYGWNVREGPCVRDSTSNCGPPPAGMTNPIFSYEQGDPSGCRAITGGAFVPAGIWPSEYDDAYLYADYVCGKIFRLDPQVGGGFVRTEFATALGSNSAVAMIFGPHQGTQALYYTTYEDSGSVRRIAYTGSANRVPIADLSASPTSGPAPLAVDFDGSDSSDPDTGDTLTYEWDFGDGQTTSGSSPTVSHTYSATGTFTAALRVRDNHGALSLPDTVQIQPGNTAPTPVIETPASGATFRVGQNVVLRGSATDPQDGTVPASSLRWQVLRHHGTSHTHPWLPDTAGNDIPISTPGPEDLATTTTSYLEVRLTATDSAGLPATVTRQFRPTLVDLTFATEPAGLALQLNGEPVTAPRTFSSWENWTFPAAAARQQDGSGAWWVFDHWSDAGAATHNVTTGATPATYTATFRPNAAPVATGSSVSTPEDTARTISLTASDVDGDAISRAISRNPAGGTLGAIAGANVVYTPTAQQNGGDSFEFTASDGAATSSPATVSITVTEVNDPADAVNDTTSVGEDGSVLVDVRANDTKGPSNESSQTLTVASVTTPAHGTATIEAGSVRYQPAANYSGPDSFGYQVCDNGTTNGAPDSRCDSATVSVTVSPVNDPPVAVDDGRTTAEDNATTFSAASLAANDTDIDGGALSVTGVSSRVDTNGTVGLLSGQVTYTPAANFNGQGRFDYVVSDGAGGTDTGTVVVSVTPVNDAPVAIDDVRAATEDTAATVTAASLAANDTDIDGGALSVTGVSARVDTNGAVGLLSGQVTYTPAANFNGVARFDYTLSDGAGGSDTGTVSVDVAAVNDSPLAADDSATTPQATAVVIDVLANDSPGPADESAQTVTLSTVGLPAHGAAVPEAGKVRYTPAAAYTGADSFTYVACDNGAGAPCDSATVTVNVGDVSAPPVAADVVSAALEDVEAAIELVATDPNGGALSYAVVMPPAHGTVLSLVGRTALYLPAANYHGPDSFTFRASDGGLQSNVATVSVTVQPVNDAPMAGADVVRAPSDEPIVVNVLANDSTGPADEAGQTLALSAVGAPAHGTASASGGLVIYTPAREYNGADSFTYRVCDNGTSTGAPDPRCATGIVDFAFSSLPLPVNVRAPRVTGGVRAGTVAVAELGEWAAAPVGVAYGWLRCPASGRSDCSAIRGATSPRYRIGLADVGRRLRVLVTVRNRFGEAAATSAPTRPVASAVEIAAVRHRGDEWVLLRNATPVRVALAGWSLSDAGGAVHRLKGAVPASATVRVHTRAVWDARDRATLRLPGGRAADTCAYAAPRAPIARC